MKHIARGTLQVGIQIGVLAPPNEGKPTTDAIACIKAAILKAVDIYRGPTFLQLQQNCMALDVSWSKPAAQWEKVCLSFSQLHHIQLTLSRAAVVLEAKFAVCLSGEACFVLYVQESFYH